MECERWCPSWGYEDCTCGVQVEVDIQVTPEPTLRRVARSGGYLVGVFSDGVTIAYRAIAKITRLNPEPPKHLFSNQIPRATLLSAQRAKKETHTP